MPQKRESEAGKRVEKSEGPRRGFRETVRKLLETPHTPHKPKDKGAAHGKAKTR